MGSVLEILTLQALALFTQGQEERALTKLEQALEIGEPEGYVRIYVDKGEAMAELLRKVEVKNIARHYVRNVLAAFPDSERVKVGDKPAIRVSQSEIAEPLTGRELDVLRLLATELSGPEIARELMVSENTMRTHTRNIYSKLDVHNRQAAVIRARELDLL